MKRREFNVIGGLGLTGWLGGCGGGGDAAPALAPTAGSPAPAPAPGPTPTPAPAPAPPPASAGVTHRPSLTLGAASGRSVNRLALGSNVQWVDRGDEMLQADGQWRSEMLALAQSMSPGVLRYPGGLQGDVFHWAAPTNEHVFTRAQQTTRMTPQRLLELCEATGAEPLFSVNLVTGTPQEAAAWVQAVNRTGLVSSRTGRALPRVRYWELGNEPYLKEALRPDLDQEPEQFAARVNATARAMRAVDPAISLGLPISSERRNGFPVTAYPGFTGRVLSVLTEPVDFVSAHSAFLPLAPSAAGVEADYLATLAAAAAARDDVESLRSSLATLRPGNGWPIAVTEYAPMLGRGATDAWLVSPAGALMVADLLRWMVDTPQLLMANHWSLSGNGFFGAASPAGYLRSTGQVLALASRALRGQVLGHTQTADTVATPSVGLVPARAALPLFEALACREGNTLRLWLIHKDRTRPAELALSLGAVGALGSSLTVLAPDNPLAGADAPGSLRQTTSNPGAGARFTLRLPPASVALFEATLLV
jgi:alpha-N-arabinofuranosidase